MAPVISSEPDSLSPDHPTNLSDWLDHIGRQHAREMELGLDRVREVAGRLDILSFDCPVITVAGTNGKGSSVAMLESIYLAAGYRPAAYTSPHLTVFNERIRIAGEHCNDEALCDAFTSIERARDGVPLTYFEYATLAALLIFSDAKVDVMLLEVGLGGRLDAVNILPADVALITRIGLDHMQWLGDDLEAIGREKAGIIHPGCIAVVSDPEPPDGLVAAARQTAREAFLLGKDFAVARGDNDWSWQHNDSELASLPLPPMAGRAQLDNAAGVLMTVQAQSHRLPVAESAIRTGLADTVIGGRFQVVGQHPLVILDVAHNRDSAALLAENLVSQKVMGRTLAVFGMLGDKDIGSVLSAVGSLIDAWYVGGLDAPRSASTTDLVATIKREGISDVQGYETIEQAWVAAWSDVHKDDRLLVFGSFHTVGAIIDCLSQAVAIH